MHSTETEAPSTLSFSQRVLEIEARNTARMKGKEIRDGGEMHISKATLLMKAMRKATCLST